MHVMHVTHATYVMCVIPPPKGGHAFLPNLSEKRGYQTDRRVTEAVAS